MTFGRPEPAALFVGALSDGPLAGVVAAGAGPHQLAAVMVDDHDQIAVAALVGDLVDPDPTQALEPVDRVLDVGVTDKKFPGNPTQSFRSREPLRVVGELVDWVGYSPEKLQAMRGAVQRKGTGQIED